MILEKDLYARYQSINGVKYLIKNYEAFELDEVGEIVWESIDGKTSLEEISEKISTKYNINREIVIKDIQEFCKDLIEKGLVEGVSK